MTEAVLAVLAGLVSPLLDPAERVFWPSLALAVLLALALGQGSALLARRVWLHRSTGLDLQLALVKGALRLLGLVPAGISAGALALGTAGTLSRLGPSPLHGAPGWLAVGVYSLGLFVAWDLSRYVLHRLLHVVPALWALHQVHHSAEVLTPLTFHRAHPLESLLFDLRGAAVTGIVAGGAYWLFGGAASQAQLLGVGVLGLAFNALGGNLRHSHVWLSYGPRVERWLISPTQHQLHHTAEGCETNYGAWLAIWDRMGGSLALAGERRTLEFGLPASERNHEPDDLLGALVAPLVSWLPRGRRTTTVALVLALVGAPRPAAADDDDDDVATDEGDEGDDDSAPAGVVSDTVTIVERRRGLPRVAGSAHVVGEEELERFEHDDIHRVLAPVPGVYVRDEDGYGLRPNIGLRGASSDRSAKVTLLEDGVLLAPAPYSAPAAYYFPTTTRMVGVEVFKGPAAIRHGPHTIGGAINMRTRPVPTRADGGLDVAVGMRRTFKLHGHAGVGGRWWGVMLEGVHLSTDGFKQLDGGGDTGFDKTELMLKGRVTTRPGAPLFSSWELKLGYSNEVSRETYLGLTDADFQLTPNRRYAATALGLMRWNRTQAELRWRLRMGEGVDLTTVVYHHWMDRSWRKLNGFAGGPPLHDLLRAPGGGTAAVYAAILRGDEDTASPDQTLQIGTNARVFHAAGGQVIARVQRSWRKVRSELEVGVRLHGDQIARTHTEDAYSMRSGVLVPDGGPTETTADNRGRALALAAHVHEDLGIGPLRVLPGARIEVVRTEWDNPKAGASSTATRAVLLPGLGLHVQPTAWLSVLGGLHRGYSPVAPGQPAEAKPEHSWNLEGGARVLHRGTRIEAIGFFNDYVNLTGQCTFSGGCSDAQVDQQFSAGKAHVYGLEASMSQEVELPAGFGLRGSLSYTWTGSSFRTGFVSDFPQFGVVSIGDRLPYVPEHQGAASFQFRHPRGSVEIAAKAQSAMRDVAGQGAIPTVEKIDAFLVLDLAADVQINKHVALYGTVNNLTNAVYAVSRRPFGLRPGRPIHVMLGLKLRGFPEIRRPARPDASAWSE